MSQILAIVLARKNSKRLRNKNILKLNKKKLIQWTFDFLNKKKIKKLFNNILVSTDSLEIKKISQINGFLCPWLRPKKLSTSKVTSEKVALHALNWFQKNKNKVEAVCLFQPTSPFRSQKNIIEVVKLYKKKKKQIVSVSGIKTYKFKKNQINGSIYLTPVNTLKKYKSFSYKGFYPYRMMRKSDNIDIDTVIDFAEASLIKRKS